ncbi:uncharacterized protein [Rutidosis leptorrhynchoides]|uniref:uncharacterized protein n=1 Tax=Rutidosis leptorrhynchoides TaxID=125765 RepID=UPI003A9998AC
MGRIAQSLSKRPLGTLPSNTQYNPNNKGPVRNEHVNAITTRNGLVLNEETLKSPPIVSPIVLQVPTNEESKKDEPKVDELKVQEQKKDDPPEIITRAPPLKLYKAPVPYPKDLKKDKQATQYQRFLDMINQISVSMPLAEVIKGMTNYGEFLKDLISSKVLCVEHDLQELLEVDTICFVPMDGSDDFVLDAEFENFMKVDTYDELSDEEDLKEEELVEEIKEEDKFRIKTSLEEPPVLELKKLPENLEYAYHQGTSELPVIISSTLSSDQKGRLINLLKAHKKAIAWKMTDILGINPSFCTHKILLEDEYKPIVQWQRRLNPNMNDVVKKEVIKLLDVRLIYPISDSPWVSPVQVVPKKGRTTVVLNYKNELVPTHTVTGWRVCIDYRCLNNATRKDRFLLPFID